MENQRLIAGLIAGGAVLFLVAGVSTPRGLYQEPDHDARLRIIDRARARFLLAQALWALMLAVPAVGFALLATQLRDAPSWLPALGAAAIALGAGAGILFVVLQTVGPARFWLEGEATWLSTVGAWLFLGGSAACGVALIVEGMTVAGLVLVAYAVLGSVGMVVAAPAFFVLAGFMAAVLVPAISVWSASAA